MPMVRFAMAVQVAVIMPPVGIVLVNVIVLQLMVPDVVPVPL